MASSNQNTAHQGAFLSPIVVTDTSRKEVIFISPSLLSASNAHTDIPTSISARFLFRQQLRLHHGLIQQILIPAQHLLFHQIWRGIRIQHA